MKILNWTCLKTYHMKSQWLDNQTNRTISKIFCRVINRSGSRYLKTISATLRNLLKQIQHQVLVSTELRTILCKPHHKLKERAHNTRVIQISSCIYYIWNQTKKHLLVTTTLNNLNFSVTIDSMDHWSLLSTVQFSLTRCQAFDWEIYRRYPK